MAFFNLKKSTLAGATARVALCMIQGDHKAALGLEFFFFYIPYKNEFLINMDC